MSPSPRLLSRCIRYSLAVCAVSACAVTAPAWAQSHDDTEQQPAELKSVVVTGSLIKHSDLATAQPVTTIGPQQIEDSGFKSVGQLLTSMPSVGYGTGLPSGPLLGSGAEQIDLRHLGSDRLLVLINGHRFVKNFGGVVDMTQIPLAIVERIEILQNGASATYGADAISGVVNIITKKDFNGVTVSAFAGVAHGTKTGAWDGHRRKYTFTAGHSWDRGHLVFSASSREVEGIPATHREFSDLRYKHPKFAWALGSSATPAGRFQFWAPGGGDPNSPGGNFPAASTGLTSAQCPNRLYTAPNGNQGYVPYCDLTIKPGTSGHDPANYVPWKKSDGYYGPVHVPLTLNSRVKSAFTQGGIELTPSISLNFSGLYARRDNVNSIGAGGIFSSPGQSFPAGDNPFGFDLSNTDPTVLGPGLEGPALDSFARRASEVGERIVSHHARTAQFSLGLTGDFTTGNIGWNWDTNYTFASSRIRSGRTNYPLDAQLALALDPNCAASVGCVPYDPFAGAGNQSADASAFIGRGITANSHEEKEYRAYTANLSSADLFALPAGFVGLAVGYQYRKISGTSTPYLLDMIPSSQNGGDTASILKGDYQVHAVYAEMRVPLLSGLPGAERLSLDLAGRRASYSTFGTTTNTRFGLVYQPISDLLIRASRSEGFRAANLSELYSPTTTSYPYVVDPCNQYATLGSASAKEVCAAQGVPTSYVQTGRQVPARVGGNPDVQPETSVSKTIGMVYSPSWAPGLNINLDYYHIKLTNAITSVNPQIVLNRCYNVGVPSFCDDITRAANGSITGVTAGTVNSGAILTSGLDLGVGYRFAPTRFGQFNVKLHATQVREFKTMDYLPDGSTSTIRSVGVFNAGGTLTAGQVPQFKGRWTVAWNKGPWSASLTGHYISSFTAECNGIEDGTPYSAANLGLCSNPNYENNVLSTNHRKALTWWDVHAGYKTPWNLDFAVGIRNAFAAHQQGGVNKVFWAAQLDYGVYSQFFYTQVSYHFE